MSAVATSETRCRPGQQVGDGERFTRRFRRPSSAASRIGVASSNRTALVASAQQRSQETRHRAIDALRRLDTDGDGDNVTFTSVANAANVSRSWLYRQPDLRAEIDRLRNSRTATAAVPSAQRASTDSLKRRLEDTLDEIQRLKAENQIGRAHV